MATRAPSTARPCSSTTAPWITRSGPPGQHVVVDGSDDPGPRVRHGATVGVHGDGVAAAVHDAVDGAAGLAAGRVDVVVHLPRPDGGDGPRRVPERPARLVAGIAG